MIYQHSNAIKEKCGFIFLNNYQITFVYKNIKALIMEDLFGVIEKKMDLLQNYHNGILSMIGKFKEEMEEKENNYRNVYSELKTLLEIFSEYNNLSSQKSLNTDTDIGKLASKFSQASLASLTSQTDRFISSQNERFISLQNETLIDKSININMEKLNNNKIMNENLKSVSSQTSLSSKLQNVSLVSQISEQFSRNPILCESPKSDIINKSILNNDKKYKFEKVVTSSPLFINLKKFKSQKEIDDLNCKYNKYNKFSVKKKVEKINQIINSEQKDINKSKLNQNNTKSELSSLNLEKTILKSPLSTIKRSEKSFAYLHYNDSNIVLDLKSKKLTIRKVPGPKYVGDIERVVVETIIKV